VEFPFQGQEVTHSDQTVSSLTNTSVLVVVARPTTDCPFRKWLQEFSIPIEVIHSCNDLEATAAKIEAANQAEQQQYYITLIHDEAFDEHLYRRFSESRKCQLVSFGYQTNALAAAHAHTPCRIFPSIMLPVLAALAARAKTGNVERRIETNLDSSILVVHNQTDDQNGIVANKVAAASSSHSDLRVLIAEDNVVNTKVLTKTLERLGLHHIDAVDNGKKAVQAASEKSYDLIFMVSVTFVTFVRSFLLGSLSLSRGVYTFTHVCAVQQMWLVAASAAVSLTHYSYILFYVSWDSRRTWRCPS